MSEHCWAFHPVLWQLDMGLSVWAVGYHVKLIVKAGTCTNWLWGSWAEPSAHVRETYLCICFYEAYKNPPLSLAQLPPWLIYVLKFTLHCSIGEAGRWPGVWVCERVCLWVCMWELPCVRTGLHDKCRWVLVIQVKYIRPQDILLMCQQYSWCENKNHKPEAFAWSFGSCLK